VSHSVTCFSQPGKLKSRLVLEAFAQGCGGKLAETYELKEGYSAFYGVVGLEPLWRQAKEFGYYYLDNSFFDAARGTHFRVAKNRLQDGSGIPDFHRLKRFGIQIKPWQRGRHIVVAMQSDHFMREVVGWTGGADGWQANVLNQLKKQTDRPIVVRHWNRDKHERAKSLKADLQGAHALITHASAAANEALIDGIPVFVTDPLCAAAPMGGTWDVENPAYPEGREEWAATLCNRMWTLDELRQGKNG
jgi:hypothetical protein